MSLRTSFAKFGIAAAIIAGTAAPSLAATAIADTNLNVRTCGSTECRVVDVLRRGEAVEVDFCEGTWCFVEKRGRDGWVSARYLSRDRYYDDDYYDDDYVYVEPRRPHRRVIRRVQPYFGACFGGPNARFCVYD